MTQTCFLGIDQGSSSTKALAVGPDGRVLFRTRKPLGPAFRSENRVEHDPLEIVKSIRDALDESAQFLRSSGFTIHGLGLSCQRSSCLVWDEASLEPLSPVLSWRDTRGAELVQRLADEGQALFRKTGLPLTPYYSASKFRWLKDNVPAARKDTAVFGALSSFLVQHLTGARAALIDHTNAARTQLMDLRSLVWDPELIGLFGLDGIRLPELRPTAFAFGEVQTAFDGIPLLACIGDQQAATFGLGVTERGEGGINYGTGGFLMVNTGDELLPARGLMASVHYSTERMQRYLVEGSVNAVGDALEWLRNNFHLFADYSGLDDLCWRAATDVVAFIGLNGTGAPYWEAGLSSSFHGLTSESSSADVIRAAVEGISFFMKDIAAEIRTAGLEPASFAVSGGLSSLSYLVQVQADVLGKELLACPEQEVSALGAALLAGLQHGTWTTADIRRIAGQGESVSPRNNPGAEKRYRRWQELHRITKELDLR